MKSLLALLLLGATLALGACNSTTQQPVADDRRAVDAGQPPVGEP